jgi:hypothetical protein
VIRTHPDDPHLTAVEAARIARITAMAMVRAGVLTTKQQTTIDRILDGARKRADQQKGT